MYKYRLSNRQLNELFVRDRAITIAIPLPYDAPEEIVDAPPNLVDLVEWLAAQIDRVEPAHVRQAHVADLPVDPTSRAPGLAGVIGQIVPEDRAATTWHVVIPCVVSVLGLMRVREDRIVRTPQWPGLVYRGDWRCPPVAE